MNGILPYDVGLIVFLTLVVLGRIVIIRATSRLPPDTKAALVDKFSGMSAFGLVPVVVIVALYFLALRYADISPTTLTWTYLGAIALLVVTTQTMASRKLRELNMDRAYMRQYIVGRTLNLVGLAVLVATVIPKEG